MGVSPDQLCKALRGFRKRLAASDTPKADRMSDVEREINLTLEAIGEKRGRQLSASELDGGDGLFQYPDQLAQMVQEKVAAEVAKQRRFFGSFESLESGTAIQDPNTTPDPAGEG
jgi:hypothetical protein